MLLAFDIGNTNIVVGGFEGRNLQFEFRLKTDAGRTLDEYDAILTALFARRVPQGVGFQSCVISSVVPPLTGDIIRLARERVGVEPLLVGPGIKTGVSLKVTEPSSVGSDRVVNAVAVKNFYGYPGLVVDFGTATTIDYVNSDGDYEGGVIAPGAQGALDSLVQRTAKLPRIEFSWPKSVIGRSTVAAMQAGAVVGYVCLVDGLLERIMAEVGEIQHVVATGGLGKLFSEHSRCIKHYAPHLTLQGLCQIAELNKHG